VNGLASSRIEAASRRAHGPDAGRSGTERPHLPKFRSGLRAGVFFVPRSRAHRPPPDRFAPAELVSSTWNHIAATSSRAFPGLSRTRFGGVVLKLS